MHSTRKKMRIGVNIWMPDSTALRSLWHNNSLFILAIVQSMLFGVLTCWVYKHRVDMGEIKLSRSATKKRSHLLRSVVTIISNVSGSPLAVSVAAAFVALALWKKRLKFEDALFTGSLLALIPARALIRGIVRRPRPGLFIARIHGRKRGDSFPSGHVSTSIIFYGWFSVVSKSLLPENSVWQKVLPRLSIVMALLVGPTRIYLGDHWVSDVLGGYLFGGIFLCLSLHLYHALKQ